MSENRQTTILVAGTGPAGLIAALALANDGHDVALVGPPVRRDDRRTTALMIPALGLLDRVGILENLRQAAAPLRTMRIVDGTSRLIRSPAVTFRASEIGEEAFGLNIPNAVLNETLEQAVGAHPGIEWSKSTVSAWRSGKDRIEADLENGTSFTAKLAVAADGRMSPARKAAGISISARSYPQAALVLSFSHSRDHDFVSTEFHTETGPCTQVPLPGRRSSLVWVVNPATAEELKELDDDTLSGRVEERLQSMLGRVVVEAGRQTYLLSAALPSRFGRNRVMLVGEAAHVFPPIGAQGLNLGMRDVQDMVEIARLYRSDPGDSDAIKAYDAKRRPDILARSSAVSLLNRSLLSDFLPSQFARTAGLGIVGGFGPLRAFFMREGMRPSSGFVSMFGTLREKVGRQ